MAGYDLYNVKKNINYLKNLNKFKPSIILKNYKIIFFKKFSALDRIGVNHNEYARKIFKNITYQISDEKKLNLLKSHDFKFASSDRFLDQNYQNLVI